MSSWLALTSPRDNSSVGVLYVVYSQLIQAQARVDASQRAKASSLQKYLKEAASSSRAVQQFNPALPVALSTTTRTFPKQIRSAFTLIQNLAEAAPAEPLWAPRLRALAASPFYLTLAMDSHATACSSQLHTALLREAARPMAYDLAVNFEAAACLPAAPASVRTGIGRIYAPSHPSEMLPHNWALLLRKGPGLRALLRTWHSMLVRMRKMHQQPDDQWALTLALRKLRKSGGCAEDVGSSHYVRDHGSPHYVRGRRLRHGIGSPPTCHDPVRVWRLGEAFAAFKSADKRSLGFFPRYTRRLTGPVLATHHLQPYPWKARQLRQHNACAVFNERAGVARLALLSAKQDRVRMVYNASECRSVLLRHGLPASASRIAAPICGMLEHAPPEEAPTAPGIGVASAVAEPMGEFWRRIMHVRQRAQTHSSGA